MNTDDPPVWLHSKTRLSTSSCVPPGTVLAPASKDNSSPLPRGCVRGAPSFITEATACGGLSSGSTKTKTRLWDCWPPRSSEAVTVTVTDPFVSVKAVRVADRAAGLRTVDPLVRVSLLFSQERVIGSPSGSLLSRASRRIVAGDATVMSPAGTCPEMSCPSTW